MTANETTDHAWVRENVATYLAAGLVDEERARFEAHVGSCGSCLEDLQDAQGTDRSLASIFAADRPAPGLEDRVIRTLREAPTPRFRLHSSFVRVASAVAALLLVAAVGFWFDSDASLKDSSPSAPQFGLVEGHEAGGRSKSHADFRNKSFSYSTLTPPKNEAMGGVGGRPAGSRDNVEAERRSAGEMAKAKNEELLGRLRTTADDSLRMREGAAFRDSAAPQSEWARKGSHEPADTAGYRVEDEKKAVADKLEPGASRLADVDRAEAPLQGDWYFKPGSEAEGFAGGGGAGKTGDKHKALEGKLPAAAEKTKSQDQAINKTERPQDPQASQRKIIRQGELEFEVDGFDSSVDKVARIAAEEKGYIATVNSDRLPNGKVKGTIVLRVPPDALDRLVLKLRALGDLKSQRITSEDVTKKYYDLESRLKAARTMETRLIEIIKTGKGEIKDILLAEKELGEWREKIEIFEGEIRFYANMVSMSTLTLTLVEKDIKAPSLVSVTETVDTGIEAEDIPKADKDLRALIADAKGRITASDLKKLAADQFSLLIVCEVPPENAGPLRDRLNQLGRIARLDVQTVTSDDGRGRPVDGKTKRSDTVFRISVYNTTNVQPRETSHLALACPDVEDAFRKVIARVGLAAGRVVQSNLNRLKADQVDGVVQFDVPFDKGEAVLAELRGLGEVMSFKVIENPDSANVTKSKKGFHVVLFGLANVAARETTAIRFAARDVAETHRKLQALVLEKGGRILDARLNEESRDNVTATLDLELPRADRPALDDALKAAGETLTQNVQRAPDDGRVVDAKIRVTLSLQTIASVGPRRTVRIGVEVSDVDAASERITRAVTDGGGQLVDSQNSRDTTGRAVSYLVYEAPLGSMAGFVDQVRKAGTVRMEETRRNSSAPESALAIGRIELTLSNADPLVGSDAGFASQMKDAMRSVVTAGGFSLKLIVVGALIVVPWALIVWLGWKLVRKMRSKPATV